MSLWDSLVGTVTDVLGDVGSFFKPAVEAVSSFDLPDVSLPDVGGLFSSSPDLSSYMNDASLLVKDVGAKYPMTQGASMFADLGLGGVGDFVNSYGKYLYPAAKALGTAYTGRQEAKDYTASQQPLMSLSAEQQQKYRDMMDPQKRALAQARIRRNMQGDIQPMLDRITDRAFMSARRRGTPIGASTVGNYQGGLLSDMVSKAYGDIYNYASAADTQNVKDQMNMLTGQYNALKGSPQFQPTYQAAANYNPWTSMFKALIG